MHSGTQYRKIFRRLCHLVALKRNASLTSAIDRLLLTTFAYDLDFSPESADEFVDTVSVYFGVELSVQDIEMSLQRLVDDEQIILQDKVYTISPHTLADQATKIEGANELEEAVKLEWFRELEGLDGCRSVEKQESLWACLMAYMARAFYSHGVRTIQLLDPTVASDTVDMAGLETFFREAKDEHCNDLTDDLVKDALERYFRFKSRAKTRFTVQLLDSTFTYFALTTDADVARYLTDTIPPVKIFMDSNFIFGLLNLHDNALNEVSKDLVECILDNGIPFTFMYTQETLKEIERSLQYYGDRLRGVLWTRKTSRRALKSRYLSGIEQRFHRLNAASQRNADLFLSQFEQMPALLGNMGFSQYDGQSLINDQKQIDLYHEYDAYLKRRNRTKRYEMINHDVFLWRTVQESRTIGGHGLSAGAFLMSVDYNLASFDRKIRRNHSDVASTIFPNQLFQLLRPFISTSEDTDEQFVETFALPEFRAANDDYGDTASLVLKVINSYSEVSDEFASRILTDTMTLEQFKELGSDLASAEQFLSNELAKVNNKLQEEKNLLEVETARVQSEFKTIKKQSEKRETELLQEISEKASRESETQKNIEALRDESASKSEQLDEIQEELHQKRTLKRAVYKAVAFEVVALLLVGISLHTFLSDWFSAHTNRIILLVTAVVVIAVVTARIAFGHRWTWLSTNPKRNGLQASAIVGTVGFIILISDPSSGLVATLISIGLIGLINRIDK